MFATDPALTQALDRIADQNQTIIGLLGQVLDQAREGDATSQRFAARRTTTPLYSEE